MKCVAFHIIRYFPYLSITDFFRYCLLIVHSDCYMCLLVLYHILLEWHQESCRLCLYPYHFLLGFVSFYTIANSKVIVFRKFGMHAYLSIILVHATSIESFGNLCRMSVGYSMWIHCSGGEDFTKRNWLCVSVFWSRIYLPLELKFQWFRNLFDIIWSLWMEVWAFII